MPVRRLFATSVSLAAAGLLAVVSPAAAQRAAGPYADLLGGSADADKRQTLDVRASLYGAWDDILSSTDESALNDQFLQNGFAGGASGALVHAKRLPRLQWNSSAATSVRMYGKGSDAVAATFSGTTGIDSQLSRRLRLLASGSFMYSPYYGLSAGLDDRFVPAGALNGGFGIATAAQRNTTTDGDVRLEARLSRRDTLDVGANARRYEFLDQSDGSVTSYGGHGIYRHELTRSLGVHAGFTRQQGQYQFVDVPDVTNDTIDIGVDYGDTLAFTRRTALSFSSSTSMVHWRGDTHYRLDGDAALTRAFGRSGSMAMRYGRATQFEPGFREPLLSDTVTGSISNQLGVRSSWSASLGYTRGTIGFESEPGTRYNTITAGGRVTTSITRLLGVFADYGYYRYDVPAGATVFTSLPKFSRQSVSGGLTVWVPLINDRRPVGP
jgi:hypothetical protein